MVPRIDYIMNRLSYIRWREEGFSHEEIMAKIPPESREYFLKSLEPLPGEVEFKKRKPIRTAIIAILILIFLLLSAITLRSQPDTLVLTGFLAGTYTAKQEIIVMDTVQTWDVTLQIGDCDTLDELIPGIAVLRDECIRDDEWFGISNYSNVIQDSADFYSEDFLNLVKYFGVAAIDDCGIATDSFYVKSVEIIPPGGVDRPGESTRQFNILFRAVDWVGHVKEAVMRWVRVPDSMGCW